MYTPDLALKDCETVVDLARLRSVRELARQRGLAAGQISKAVRRVEDALRIRLFERSIKGVTPTPEGISAVERMKLLLKEAGRLGRARVDPSRKPLLGVGGTSFIATHLLPPVIGGCGSEPSMRFRLVEFPPNDLVAAGMKGAFDLSLHLGGHEWTRSWITEPVGKLRWGLFARADHPISTEATQDEVRSTPFVLPTYWTQEGFQIGNDSCPLPISDRLHGDETATAEAGLSLVRNTQQLCFLPTILALRALSRGELKEIRVRGWPRVENEVYVTARADRVAERIFKLLCRESSRYLKQIRGR